MRALAALAPSPRIAATRPPAFRISISQSRCMAWCVNPGVRSTSRWALRHSAIWCRSRSVMPSSRYSDMACLPRLRLLEQYDILATVLPLRLEQLVGLEQRVAVLQHGQLDAHAHREARPVTDAGGRPERLTAPLKLHAADRDVLVALGDRAGEHPVKGARVPLAVR